MDFCYYQTCWLNSVQFISNQATAPASELLAFCGGRKPRASWSEVKGKMCCWMSRWGAVGAQSWAGLLPAGGDQEGCHNDIAFPVNPLKWHMSLCKDYKQILRRQCPFVHVTNPQAPRGQAMLTLCEFRVPGFFLSKRPYLSVSLFAKNFRSCQPLGCTPKGVVIMQKKKKNSNSHSSIQSVVPILQMGTSRPGGFISFLGVSEGDASPEPMSFDSRMLSH